MTSLDIDAAVAFASNAARLEGVGKDETTAIEGTVRRILEAHRSTAQQALGAKANCYFTKITWDCPTTNEPGDVIALRPTFRRVGPSGPLDGYGAGFCIPVGRCTLCFEWRCDL